MTWVSVLTALLVLGVLPRNEGRLLRGCWAWSLISLTLASSEGTISWPVAVSGAVWPVFALISGVFLLSGLYSLTWRRAYLDELTDLPGRRALEERLRRLAGRYTIAMVDVDRFKQFNDRYGHSMGDHVLRFVASRLKRVTGGRAFRYGGEEFAVVWSGRGLEEVLPTLESFRIQVEESRLTVRGKDRPRRRPRGRKHPRGGTKKVNVTVSIGAAQRSRLHPTPWEVLRAADAALYRAKRRGRNRIEVERRQRPRA
jgi:diguanylate cyclase (GGDEF)-like protein